MQKKIIEMSKHTKCFIGYVLILVGVIFVFYLEFTHIDMTEARMFITFWKQYLIIFAIFIVAGFLISKKQRY